MSYEQAMRWQRKHPKGTRQPVLFSTDSGFWPSRSWLENKYWPYVAECKKINVAALDAERFYNATVKTGHISLQPADYAQRTKSGIL